MNVALNIYLCGGAITLFIGLVIFGLSLAAGDRRSARGAARSAILAPVWPLVVIWWMYVLCGLLWQTADLMPHKTRR